MTLSNFQYLLTIQRPPPHDMAMPAQVALPLRRSASAELGLAAVSTIFIHRPTIPSFRVSKWLPRVEVRW